MQLPRFSPVDDRALKRFRFQAIFIAIVWGLVAGIRTAGINHSGGVVAITVLLWVICIGFFAASALAFVEVSRRKAETLS
jgi:CHASE2 domain-containing sensor protein